MDRPVVVGSASGLLSSLALTLLKGLSEHPIQPLDVLNHCLECAPSVNFEDFPWAIFGAGLLCGLAIGPLLDLAWVIRERWRRFIWNQVALTQNPPYPSSSRPLHKVLA